jgi:bacteriocin-like protein
VTDPKKPQKMPKGPPTEDKPAATARELSEEELKKIVGGAKGAKKGA